MSDREAQVCRSCRHPLGIGRFCVNCGHPKAAEDRRDADPLTTTAERPVVARAPLPPPPVHQPPRPARYPLYADEPRTSPASLHPPLPDHRVDPVVRDAAPDPSAPVRLTRRSAAPWWVAGAVAVVLLLAGGGLALLGGDDPADDPAGEAPAAIAPAPSDDRIPVPSAAAPSQGDGAGREDGDANGDAGAAQDPVDVSRLAEATAPATAAPSRDVRGNAVRYDAANMLDGQPDTAWRMPGDGTGSEVVLRLDEPTTIVAVGLVNGYAKVEPGYDGYPANRRVTAVEWVFDDGTVVPQTLAEDRDLQGIEVDAVTTSTVTLRIVAVTEPALGPAGRDYTAISEVALAGTPG